ncbi:bifunctional lycopene cyclase/phytoene synthase-like [Contarinia nasturtii]|uniref:bifunctional lycopene cyclase/phytoene synthase-like n=1 Tax=Contarinia nasturtii TaxID=265458 RepID=UPI0012D38ED6|nr:bifunctional lycopene cyclase/phytoene synthase-like [Contarinia nasturtii]XP_031621321.1 bifunctional lycopene cyclase/phytoene synthase-like [Contarinia nasturtii]XP_031621322.1 bifunctional lycopene cyclase/phytoene synthase-like [Contarinia nasturtii]XP_031621323.1 bifunctional lycopene cyclase/phytoene synthase-like [Contarinia nasturtii]
MLTYLQVHIYYTLPPTILLYLLMRPLIGSFDKIKMMVLCVMAVLYTTPWDNYIIYNKAWWYRKDAVIGTIGYVPIEEYLFFVIQTIHTTLWTSLCSRWTLHSLHLKNYNRPKFHLIRYGVIAISLVFIVAGYRHAIPATKPFYLGCMTCWVFVVVTLLWYMSGPYIVKRYKATLISILVPSIYLCYVDLIALRARVWHINEATSLEIFPIEDLPLEEILFFFFSNMIVALGSHAFDKSKAVVDTYFEEPFPIGSNVSGLQRFFGYLKMIIERSVCDEYKFDPTAITDLETCIVVLDKASKSFSMAANFFPNDIKQDLTILYAFCRVTDDMVDNEHSIELKKERIRVIVEFLDQLFSNRTIKSEYCWERNGSSPKIDWKYFEETLTKEQLSSFRAIARISYYMPSEPFYELVEGYKWDIDGRPVLHENDLIEYSKYVASSVATLCTFVFCHKGYKWPDTIGPMLENARKMGLVLQICNISRDIIVDSETLGRCYVPSTYFENDERNCLVNERNPKKIPNVQLKKYAEKMLDIADNLANEAMGSINLLPSECQRAVLSSLEIYQGIGKLIRRNAHYEHRTFLPKFDKICIVFKCLYFTSMSSLCERNKTKKA